MHWSWRSRLAALGGALLVLTYVVAVVTVFPERLISSGDLSGVDANTRLNAITATRVALLGLLAPAVLILGGIVAALTYRETVQHNRQADELARQERDETRRLRRAEVYSELLRACEECVLAAEDCYHADPEDTELLNKVSALLKLRAAMGGAADRVMLLGADEVQPAAFALDMHVGVRIASEAGKQPRLTEEEWHRNRVVDYAPLYKAFLDLARKDLEPTR